MKHLARIAVATAAVTVSIVAWTFLPSSFAVAAQSEQEEKEATQTKAKPAARARSGSRLRGRGVRRGSGFPGPTLSRQQLKQCVLSEAEINRLSHASDEESIHLENAALRLENLGLMVARSEASVDEYSQQSVNSHNRLIEQYNQELEEYNARIPGAQARQSAVNRRIDTFNSACADRAYYLDDMAAVEKELGIGA
jgi:chromosome segregation ATPase